MMPLSTEHMPGLLRHTPVPRPIMKTTGEAKTLHLAEDLMQLKETLSELFSGCDSNLLQFGVCEDRLHFCIHPRDNEC